MYPYEEEFGEDIPFYLKFDPKTDYDVYSSIYMNDMRKESWGKRPLAKLTHDVHPQFIEESKKLKK